MKLASNSLALALAFVLSGCALFMLEPTGTGLGTTTIAVQSPMTGAALMDISYENVEYGAPEVFIDIAVTADNLSIETASETFALTKGQTYKLKMPEFSSSWNVDVYDAMGNLVADLTVKPQAWAAISRTLTVALTEQGYSEITENKILLEVYYDKAKKVFTILDKN